MAVSSGLKTVLFFHRQLNFALISSYRYYCLPKKIVLGIETSCDDTGAAIVDESGSILGESLASQMKIHLEYCSPVILVTNFSILFLVKITFVPEK